MPYGKGTYGSKRGRPPKKKTGVKPKKAGKKMLNPKQKTLPKKLQKAIKRKKR
jgi:hypothetical protein